LSAHLEMMTTGLRAGKVKGGLWPRKLPKTRHQL